MSLWRTKPDRETSALTVPESFPIIIGVEPGSRCNLHCTFCTLTQQRSSTAGNDAFISEPLWHKLAGEFERDVESVIFAGFGEPTLNRRFHEMLIELDARNIPTSFSTNAISLPSRLLATLPKLRCLTHINVSIDSPDPAIYRKMRGGNLHKVLANVRKLSCIKGSFVLSVSSIAMKSNIESLLAMPPLLRELGVKNYIVQSLFDQSEEGLGEALHGLQGARAHLHALERIVRESKINLHYELPGRISLETVAPTEAQTSYFVDLRKSEESRIASRRCMLPWQTTHIDSNGSVFPCCRAAAENSSSLGNLNNQTLSGIWHGRAYQNFRRALLGDGDCPAICATCTVAPVGWPPVRDFAASLLPTQSCLTDGRIEVVARNIGRLAWTESRTPVVGTAGPRDRFSRRATNQWLSAERPAKPQESHVPPGGLAHFRFELSDSADDTPEEFQLVLDGSHWLPGTRFAAS